MPHWRAALDYYRQAINIIMKMKKHGWMVFQDVRIQRTAEGL